MNIKHNTFPTRSSDLLCAYHFFPSLNKSGLKSSLQSSSSKVFHDNSAVLQRADRALDDT